MYEKPHPRSLSKGEGGLEDYVRDGLEYYEEIFLEIDFKTMHEKLYPQKWITIFYESRRGSTMRNHGCSPWNPGGAYT